MENYYYLCPVCGYRHQVPAYWLSFDPPAEMEAEHINLQLCQACANIRLVYDPEYQEES